MVDRFPAFVGSEIIFRCVSGAAETVNENMMPGLVPFGLRRSGPLPWGMVALHHFTVRRSVHVKHPERRRN